MATLYNESWIEIAFPVARDADGRFLRYTDHGCYPVYHLTDDGEAMCADCANGEAQVHTGPPDNGWRIVGSDINYEDPELRCVHCGERIESACDEPELPEHDGSGSDGAESERLNDAWATRQGYTD